MTLEDREHLLRIRRASYAIRTETRLDAAKAYAKKYAQSYGAEHFEWLIARVEYLEERLGDIAKFEENFDPELLPWIGARVRKGLMALGVETYGKLAALTSSEVLATKNMGQNSLMKLRNVLATRGLCFRDEATDYADKMHAAEGRHHEAISDRDRWKARAEAAEWNFHSTLDHIRDRGDWVRFNDHCAPPIPYTVTQ
jgi:hypothetical protein